jgi:hypothetical protein
MKNRREKQAETNSKTIHQGAALPRGHEKSPPMSSGGRHSHKSEARISAIADFARKGKREKKALPLSPPTDRRHDKSRRLGEKFLPTLGHLRMTGPDQVERD